MTAITDTQEALRQVVLERRRAAPTIGILFKGHLVRSILTGTKTETRRLIADQARVEPWPDADREDGNDWARASFIHAETCPGFCEYACGGVFCNERGEVMPEGERADKPTPYGGPGSRLYVKETWALYDMEALRYADGAAPGPVTVTQSYKRHVTVKGYGTADALAIYQATPRSYAERNEWDERWPRADRRPWTFMPSLPKRWRPGIHMPRWASRLTLEVAQVRVQRLQDITEEEARAEGVAPFHERYEGISADQRIASCPAGKGHRHHGPVGRPTDPDRCCFRAGDQPYRASFAVTWDEINADRLPGGAALWSHNPWVYAVTFSRVEDKTP